MANSNFRIGTANKFMQCELTDPDYWPARLLNKVSEYFGVDTDLQLAIKLGYDYNAISRIRRKRKAICANFVITIMDHTTFTLPEIRELCGVQVPPRMGDVR